MEIRAGKTKRDEDEKRQTGRHKGEREIRDSKEKEREREKEDKARTGKKEERKRYGRSGRARGVKKPSEIKHRGGSPLLYRAVNEK